MGHACQSKMKFEFFFRVIIVFKERTLLTRQVQGLAIDKCLHLFRPYIDDVPAFHSGTNDEGEET